MDYRDKSGCIKDTTLHRQLGLEEFPKGELGHYIVDIVTGNAGAVEEADYGTHGVGDHEVGDNPFLLQLLKYTQVGHSPGSTARKDKS